MTAALSEAEVVELVSLVEVTDGDLASRAMTERAEAKAKAVARRMYWGCD